MDCKWFWVLLVMVLVSSAEGCWEEERTALLQLKHLFSNSRRYPYNWVENSECCRWESVTCDNTGRVINLDLYCIRDWNLGEWYLNASLFSPFQQLQSLNLSCNNIAGCIENEGFERLSRLSNLKELNLEGNNFNNNILSSLDGLSSLKYLNLESNGFKGAVNIEGLHSLKELDMSSNEIDHFVSPKGLSNLEVLDLSYNNLNNSILSSLGDLSSLKSLYLNNNGLTGTVDVQGLSNLEVINLSGNNLSHNILSSLGGLSSLKSLYLRDIGLNGTVDVEGLCSLKNLEELYMDWNKIDKFVNSKDNKGLKKLNALSLYGGIETADAIVFLQSILRLFPSLKTLDLSCNSFNQTMIARELHNLTTLEELNLDGSELHISFLQTVATCTSLKHLSMRYCELNGISQVQGRFDISINFFHGQIPIEIDAKLPKLYYFNISRNSFNGGIPSSFGNMSFLQFLDLSNNKLAGGIPEHLAIGCFSLAQLVLSNNKLQGHIFSNTMNLKQLVILQLDGEIPRWIRNLSTLVVIAMSNNELEGIKQVYLSRNRLQGQLKDAFYINSSNLVVLDLSYNHFKGTIPSWIGKLSSLRLPYLSYLGNPFLCGLPLNKSCNPVESPSLTPRASTDNKEEDDSDFVDMDIFYVTFVVTYIVVLLVIVGILYVNPYWRRTWFYLVEKLMISCYYFVIDHLP
ncbi:hypothetical protein Patl1_14709 [Pistacia atlantica]|uniref:Uncharacterized protein n=1 Tax=Pistacia atlantica TaxID=434234 RepID=A0ACC1ATI5_9ROSI|nr:hypothetical protein Patl1_14709 [Pistacia atlantica]